MKRQRQEEQTNHIISAERGKAIMEDEDKDCEIESFFLNATDGKSGEINIGMIFTCEDEAYDTYNSYAISKGFGVRRDKKYWNKTQLSTCIFVCSCEGKSPVRDPHEEIKRERLEFRCGCEARIKFKVTNEVWKVVEFNDRHNHDMIEKKHRHFISSARKLTKVSRQIISSLVDSGVGPTKAFRYLTKEAGGIENVGFIEQDVHNYQQSRRRSLIASGDAQSLLNYFAKKQLDDANFFYTFQLDEDGRLCNVFWRDSVSKLHYECFGDVMIFDTTYRTNKWNMVFAPFVGLNNHWKNIYFGCAFLHDETSVSFEWLFRSFLDSMEGKQPKTIFTDQDHAMGVAIRNVLPNARHRLCEWHIEKNAAQRIPHLFSKSNFNKYFNKLLWDCKSENEFYLTWKRMVDEFNVGEHPWLKRLYSLREKWCSAFSRDTFSGDIRSTQRGESANRVFSDLTCQSTTLIEFANQYEDKIKAVRGKEKLDDHKTRGRPKLQVRDCGILEDAAKAYTRKIFFKFQDEFLQCVSDWYVQKTIEESYETYTLKKDEEEDSYIVRFHSVDRSIVCSCHKFETLGWLCRHALRIMHIHLGFKTVPEVYILKRWTKGAKQGVAFDKDVTDDNNTKQLSMTTRLSSLLRESYSVMSLAAGDDVTESIAKKYLNAAKIEIIQYQNEMFSCEEDGLMNDDVGKEVAPNVEVHDPINKRRKGQRNIRMKGILEKKRGKRSCAKPKNLKGVPQNIGAENGQSIRSDHEIVEQVQFEHVTLNTSQTMSFTQLLNQANYEALASEVHVSISNGFDTTF